MESTCYKIGDHCIVRVGTVGGNGKYTPFEEYKKGKEQKKGVAIMVERDKKMAKPST